MIKIGGIIKHSTRDYPGRIASVIFIRGCDFRCPFCHNPELIYTEGDVLSPLSVSNTIKGLKKWIDGVCITGGEPLLYPDVIDLINYIKKEIALPVKIDTNGNHPEMLERIIDEGLVDYIAMDIKHIPGTEGYEKATGKNVFSENIINSINLLKNSNI
ncbi:MAG: anaerobic ribonucleoside-triphosphate reductase activating protein [Candidatus Muiribacterium halophilum]|uniref:Anaerobic ribonucleoside-triphosphate reductase activating protein n=1 Tax=Muiribacterium halophilum TaxID=2053465 RepID=A0A2N5ZKQ4_MUIH1|nr:MAG: anaerobic ribonucleoside-triphosphate reductase activating protein [Candidatus Muirbacterium halophilum]